MWDKRVGRNQKLNLGHIRLEMLLDIQVESTAASGLHKPEACWVHLGRNSKSADHLQMRSTVGSRTEKQEQMSVEG